MLTGVPIPNPLAVGFDNPYIIQQSLEALAGPLGITLAAIGLFLTLGVLSSKRLYWVTVSLLLFASTLTSHLSFDFGYAYSGIIQSLADQGRNLVLLFLLILLLPSLLQGRGTRSRLVHGGMVAYFVFQVLYTFELAASRGEGSVLRLVVGLILFTLTFVVFSFGLGKVFQDGADVLGAVKSMAWAGVIFAGVTAYEVLENPHAVIVNGRLSSVTATATFCAELFVAVMLPTIYLIINGELSRGARAFWVIMLSLEGVMLIGTGTRTGLLMLVIGIVIQLRARLAKIFPLAVGLAIVVNLILLILPEDLGIIGADRIFNFNDTRSEAWGMGLDAFLSSPFFGVSAQGQSVLIENSYLSVFAMSGLVGAIPFLIALVLFARSMIQLLRRRPFLNRSDQLFIDMVVAGLCAELAGAFFDAYLMATVSVQLYVVVIYTSLLLYALERTEAKLAVSKSPGSAVMPPLAYDPAYAI